MQSDAAAPDARLYNPDLATVPASQFSITLGTCFPAMSRVDVVLVTANEGR